METLSCSQIKKKIGDSWALIYNPIYSEKTGKLIKGDLSYWNTNRDKVENMVLEDTNPKKHFTILFFGKIPNEKLLLNFF